MTNSVLENAWAAVSAETGSGVYQRRLDESLPFYVTVTNPGRLPGLSLIAEGPVDLETAEIRGSDKIELVVVGSVEVTDVRLQARSEDASEIFLQVAADLVERVLSAATSTDAAIVLVRRFNTWQRFLRQTSGGVLSQSKRLGLFGELAAMRDLMVPIFGIAQAVESWTGPSNAPQDFQTGRIAVEVKSISHSEPQILKIDGERQLDDFGLEALVLAHHRVFRHRGSGQTLPEIVAELKALIGDAPVVQDEFSERLFSYGYNEIDAERNYGGTGYSLQSTTYYRVREGFPRLIETDLVEGMGALKYSVAAGVCERFAIAVSEISSWFSEPDVSVEPAVTPESQTVEYKETVWAPVGDMVNEQQSKEVGRKLQTAVVKSVVALMNSQGGELVLGVRDSDRSITGIEVDLAARGIDTTDLDAFERQLMELLITQIDALVPRQVRIRFMEHGSATTCHVAVAPSPNPRFGMPLRVKNEVVRPLFWVRAGNSTRVLEGSDLLDYVAQHWH